MLLGRAALTVPCEPIRTIFLKHSKPKTIIIIITATLFISVVSNVINNNEIKVHEMHNLDLPVGQSFCIKSSALLGSKTL